MDSRLKTLGLVCAIQFACVAVGFWVQALFLNSISDRNAAEAAWEQIQTAGELIAQETQSADPQSLNLSAIAQQLHARPESQPWQLTVVDPSFQASSRQPSSEKNKPHKTLTWQPLPANANADAGPQLGMLQVDDTPNVAAAFPLREETGYLLVHVPIASIRIDSAQFLGSMPLSVTLSSLWTCTLLAICSYLVYTKISENHATSQLNTDTQSLQKAQSLVRTQDAVIFGLANLAESRDPETGMHLERISLYATTLARALRRNPRYSDIVDEEFVRLIGTSSALHDIGKVGIEDAILRKAGRLSEAERKEIQKHPLIGSNCLLKIERRLGASNFLHMAREIARSHHEWWDGSGYPDRLIGDKIPLAARIVSIADVYDALATRRVYKPDLPHVACVGFVKRGAGTQFDPDLVAAFLDVEHQFRKIAQQHSDTDRAESNVDTSSPITREHVDIELSAATQGEIALSAD